MITISTHVLDSATGRPAAGMLVTLETTSGRGGGDSGGWHPLGHGVTDSQGRLKAWDGTGNSGETGLGIGDYRLIFETKEWFGHHGRKCFYPEVVITFTITDDGSHYHVPLLLAAYAYSTYRGS